jgi:hypothetical protein
MEYNEDKIVQQLASIYSDVMGDGIEDVRFYLQKEALDLLSDGLCMEQYCSTAFIACDLVNDNYDNILFFAEELRNEG